VLKLDPDLIELLQVSHAAEIRATAFYDGELVGPVPITQDGSLRYSADQVVQCAGSVFLARDSASMVPRSKADTLAPFGQEVRIDRVDRKGSAEWVTTLGQLRIQKVPSMREYFRRYPSLTQVTGWSAQLDLQDRFAQIAADDFLYPESPKPGNSTWREIQRLSPVPIVIAGSLPDRAVPSSLTAYPKSRMETLTALFSNLGAYPHMTRFGALTGRAKDVWMTATTPVFTIDGVIDMDDSMTGDLFNAVKVSSSAGANGLFAVRQITDPGNPLRVNGPFGRRVFTQSSPLYESQADVDHAADTLLRRVSTRQVKTVKVTCLPQPHLELGDYIAARQKAEDGTVLRTVSGEITTISAPLDATASWTLELIMAESS
jgi:hypothetical protein